MSHSPMSPTSPVSPTYSSGAALQRVSARLTRPSLSRRNTGQESSNELVTTPLALPSDVQPNFAFHVAPVIKSKEKGERRPGIRLYDYKNSDAEQKNRYAPNVEIMTTVSLAHVMIDVKKTFPTGKIIYQRACLPGETEQPPRRTINLPDCNGIEFTWGQFLSLLMREQYRGAEEAVTSVAYQHLWLIAIRRSNGADGEVRWFPELEMRVPVMAESQSLSA